MLAPIDVFSPLHHLCPSTGGSHGVHSLHCDPRSALGLQEVLGALPLPPDGTLHQAPLAQKGCAGVTRHQAGVRRQH